VSKYNLWYSPEALDIKNGQCSCYRLAFGFTRGWEDFPEHRFSIDDDSFPNALLFDLLVEPGDVYIRKYLIIYRLSFLQYFYQMPPEAERSAAPCLSRESQITRQIAKSLTKHTL
jgi:hypothetical protein